MADEEAEPTFESLGLSPDLCASLRRLGWTLPASFTVKALPGMLSGRDIVGKVVTIGGIDKTATYLVTVLEKLRHRVPHGGGPRALILTPDIGMAGRRFRYAEKLAAFTGVMDYDAMHSLIPSLLSLVLADIVIMLLDGDNMESELERLAQKPPDAIIATPDTLIQHLSVVDLHTVELFVIDGAKELFATPHHLNQILDQLNENRQTLLFTTFRTAAVANFIRTNMRNPKLVWRSETWKKVEALNLSLHTLGLERPCVGVGHHNNLQGPPYPTQCVDVNARNKKRAVHDGMEEAGNSKRRAENSMDED